MNQLLASSQPLITLAEGKDLSLPPSKDRALSITSTGLEVLADKLNWSDIAGGVYLDSKHVCCWNSATRSVVKNRVPEFENPAS